MFTDLARSLALAGLFISAGIPAFAAEAPKEAAASPSLTRWCRR
ncbi:hypothetical protein [Leclercia adecarboxylata]|nr:hypothetical protein [Leclercia adecarboxylata]